MAKIKGVCKNYDNCVKADNKEIQEVERSAKFVCEECGKPLQPMKTGGNTGGGGKPKPVVLIAIAVVILGVIGAGAYFIFGGNKDCKDPVITSETLTVQVGETLNLMAKTDPEGHKIVWSSGDKDIASVNDRGVVRGKSEGSVTITATDEKCKTSASVTINVEKKDGDDGPDPDPGPDPTPVYTVSFNSNDGSTVDSQSVNKGGKATKPSNPTKKDNIFDGWYTDNAFTSKWDFASEVTKDLTLYAKWNKEGGPTTINYPFGKYVGEARNGIPHGQGTMTYTCRVKIAKEGTNHCVEIGDSFTGRWENGDIANGELRNSKNERIASIRNGRRPSPYNLNDDKCGCN